MKYRRAVEKLRILAETCERVKLFWSDTEPFLKAAYAFGEVLDGADPLDAVQVAVAINLPPEEVPWEGPATGHEQAARRSCARREQEGVSAETACEILHKALPRKRCGPGPV